MDGDLQIGRGQQIFQAIVGNSKEAKDQVQSCLSEVANKIVEIFGRINNAGKDLQQKLTGANSSQVNRGSSSRVIPVKQNLLHTGVPKANNLDTNTLKTMTKSLIEKKKSKKTEEESEAKAEAERKDNYTADYYKNMNQKIKEREEAEKVKEEPYKQYSDYTSEEHNMYMLGPRVNDLMNELIDEEGISEKPVDTQSLLNKKSPVETPAKTKECTLEENVASLEKKMQSFLKNKNLQAGQSILNQLNENKELQEGVSRELVNNFAKQYSQLKNESILKTKMKNFTDRIIDFHSSGGDKGVVREIAIKEGKEILIFAKQNKLNIHQDFMNLLKQVNQGQF